jgi:hypothetical protein
MKKSLLFVLLLASSYAYSQYTLIPDLNFENKLIAYGLDSGSPDGKVLTSNINTRTFLDVSYCNIADLTGIQDFVALTNLICNSNQLTTLDLSKNTALTNLVCSSNLLTSLDVSKSTALTKIECFVNQLRTLDVSTNSVLNYLDCSSNKLTTLDVSKNIIMTNLKCYGNKIATLDFTKNTTLGNLDCSANLLTSLNVSLNTVLITLNCSGNQLTVLDLTKDTVLYSFYCSGNQFKNLDVSKNTALYAFGCDNNQLTTLDVSNNTALCFLHCDYNQFATLDVSKNTALLLIYCSSNPLLKKLNLKNGNNMHLTLDLVNNPNLTCIQVDDATYSNANWSSYKDAKATYNTSCALGLTDLIFSKMALYPNPTKGQLHIDNVSLQKASVYDALGKLVKTQSFGGELNKTLDLRGVTKGVYFIYLQSEGANIARKIVVE